MPRTIDTIIIHCAATPNGKPFFIEDIDRWHIERGFKRSEKARLLHRPELLSVGYHHVIDLEGRVASGRHHDEIGAHASGHNAHSIGICLIGTDKFTPKQWESLAILQNAMWSMYPSAKTVGHRDLPNVAKTCPGFSVADWLKGNLKPLAGHILEG